MGLIERVKQAMGSEPPEEYEYRCTVCHVTFTSQEPTAGAAACPSCGATEVEPLG